SFYSGCCGLFVPDDPTAFMTHHVAAPHALPPYWWGSVRLQVGVADLTCARSVVRHLVPFVHPFDRLRRFGHVSGLAVRRCDDLAARSDFALSTTIETSGGVEDVPQKVKEAEDKVGRMRFAVTRACGGGGGRARAGALYIGGSTTAPIETPSLLISTRKGLPNFVSRDHLAALPTPDSLLLHVSPLHL
ncbi:hypothetical protein BHE74_00040017, partial [Ensete ventricosum]